MDLNAFSIQGLCVFLVCVCLCLLQVLVTCKRETGLNCQSALLCFCVFVWAVAAIANIAFISGDDVFYDGDLHETEARVVADRWWNGDIQFSDFIIFGNGGYRFALGSFYALTSFDKTAIYSANCVLGFCGMLFVLEGCINLFEVRQCPSWFVAINLLLPTLLVWCTANLKEGAIMFSLGLIFRWFCVSRKRQSDPFWLAQLGFAFVALFYLRPHIAAIWFCGMAGGRLNPTRNPGKAIATLALLLLFCAGALLAIDIVRPGFLASVSDEGLTGSMASGYEERMDIGATAIRKKPIPLISGLLLVAFGPPPSYWNSPVWILFSFEALCITTILAFTWLKRRGDIYFLARLPIVAGSIFTILIFAFYLSYCYNMGLAVRQKMQVFPSLIAVIAAGSFGCKARQFIGDARRSHKPSSAYSS